MFVLIHGDVLGYNVCRTNDVYRLLAAADGDVGTRWARNRERQVWREDEVEVGDPVLPCLTAGWENHAGGSLGGVASRFGFWRDGRGRARNTSKGAHIG